MFLMLHRFTGDSMSLPPWEGATVLSRRQLSATRCTWVSVHTSYCIVHDQTMTRWLSIKAFLRPTRLSYPATHRRGARKTDRFYLLLSFVRTSLFTQFLAYPHWIWQRLHATSMQPNVPPRILRTLTSEITYLVVNMFSILLSPLRYTTLFFVFRT